MLTILPFRNEGKIGERPNHAGRSVSHISPLPGPLLLRDEPSSEQAGNRGPQKREAAQEPGRGRLFGIRTPGAEPLARTRTSARDAHPPGDPLHKGGSIKGGAMILSHKYAPVKSRIGGNVEVEPETPLCLWSLKRVRKPFWPLVYYGDGHWAIYSFRETRRAAVRPFPRG